MSMSKAGEINTGEEIEWDKIYEAMYIMGMKATRWFNRGRVGRTPKYKKKRNPKRKMNMKP